MFLDSLDHDFLSESTYVRKFMASEREPLKFMSNA